MRCAKTVVVLGLAGCLLRELGCARPSAVALPASRPSFAVQRVAAAPATGDTAAPSPPENADCRADGLRVVIDDDLSLRCWPKVHCRRKLRVIVHNCTDEERVVLFAGVNDGPPDNYGTAYYLEPFQHIKARARLTLELPPGDPPVLEAGAHTLWVVARRANADLGLNEHPEGDLRAEVQLELVDADEAAAKAACIGQGNDWQRPGGLLTFFNAKQCETVMPDENKSCSDGRDCQGFCELDRLQRVSPKFYRVIGHCTRHRSTMGCHSFVGDTQHGLLPADQHFSHTCVE